MKRLFTICLLLFILKKKDIFHRNFIVLGPWFHGQWARAKGDSLGKIDFENNTAVYFQALQKKWVDYWLKGKGDGKFNETTCFQSGSDQWKTYDTLPPRNAVQKKLYVHSDGTCSFEKPTMTKATPSYLSDPEKPVPYRERPIEATYGKIAIGVHGG